MEDVNYAKRGLDEATVRAIVAAAGSVSAVLNGRHALAREKGWVEKPPSVDAFAKAAAADPNLLRRPIFVRGKTVLVGYDKASRDAWAALE